MTPDNEEEKERPTVPRNIFVTTVAVLLVIIVILAVFVGFYASKVPTSTTKSIVFDNWWATTGKVALGYEETAFETAYPHYAVSSDVKPGAGGTAAKSQILAAIKAGNPPNTFQTHFGPEMISYVEVASGGISSFTKMNSAATSISLTNKTAFSQALLAGTFNGTMLSLPVTLHRGAQLYFDYHLLNSLKLPVPNNITTLMSDAKALETAGIPGFMIPGNDGGWDQLNLWEDFFLSVAGPTLYDEVMYGTIDLSNTTVQHDMNLTNLYFQEAVSMSYSGQATLSWTQGLSKVNSGLAGFQANGNWATNYAYDYFDVPVVPAVSPYLGNSSYTIMDETFPGTSGIFAAVIDSVAVPSGSAATAGLTFAEYFSSFAGQSVFTKWKADTFYNNITSSSFYNSPMQWYNYQSAKTLEGNPSAWVYQLSDGGLFDDVFSNVTSDIITFEASNSTSNWNTWMTNFGNAMSSEQKEWKHANSLGLGYMGTSGNPFGGYLPPWVSSTNSAVQTSVHASPSANGKTFTVSPSHEALQLYGQIILLVGKF